MSVNMTLLIGSVLAFTLFTLQSCQSTDPIVKTRSGLLEGKIVSKTGKTLVQQYLGVPFAEPPTGPRRFQNPQPLTVNPDRVIDARNHALPCIQHPHMAQAISPMLNIDPDNKVSEDCLYLNIYVPVLNGSSDSNNLPVMVWFPGEGFDFADSNQFDGTYLAAYGKVIVVTVQYRVGVFGFLKDGIVSQGNMGLWDQIEALKWIQENVASFGGDSKKVTVFGEFTGSMSISHFLASPILRETLRDPLFQRAILMSGVAVGDWTLDRNPVQRSVDYLRSLGCDRLNASKCLFQMDSDQLLAKAGYAWRPTIDSLLIEDEPMKILARGEIARGVEQVMIGSTESEGSLCLLHWMATKSKLYAKFIAGEMTEQEVLAMAKKDLKTYQTASGDDHFQQLLRNIRAKSGAALIDEYVNFCSSMLVHSHNERLASILVTNNHVETISYMINYKPGFSMTLPFIKAAGHRDDSILAFALPANPNVADRLRSDESSSSREDLAVSQSFVNLLTSFSLDTSSSRDVIGSAIIVSKVSPSSSTRSKKSLATSKSNCNGTQSCPNEKSFSTLVNSIDSRTSLQDHLS